MQFLTLFEKKLDLYDNEIPRFLGSSEKSMPLDKTEDPNDDSLKFKACVKNSPQNLKLFTTSIMGC